MAQFERVAIGMTLDEVRKVFGCVGTLKSSTDLQGVGAFSILEWHGSLSGSLAATTFNEGRWWQKHKVRWSRRIFSTIYRRGGAYARKWTRKATPIERLTPGTKFASCINSGAYLRGQMKAVKAPTRGISGFHFSRFRHSARRDHSLSKRRHHRNRCRRSHCRLERHREDDHRRNVFLLKLYITSKQVKARLSKATLRELFLAAVH